MLTFRADSHEYRWDGQVVRSVSQMIRRGGLNGAIPFYAMKAAARGTRVHHACMMADLNDPYDLGDDEQGYVDSYRLWSFTFAPQWLSLEEPCYSEEHQFAGTPDRIGQVGGMPTVADIKTGSRASWHGIQMALYDLLVPCPVRRTRVGIYLEPGKAASTFVFDDASDYDTARALINDGRPGGFQLS